eukprot:TRINITY_DN2724_c0_g1_i1.p1 TRINITY_DN2724_c0_g1~~TRINITY_DN2724_c0_g1_i1.p1  ORF type:complete len:472 (+),score=117.30 TRINITY_DN2724_c0_g1_i1:55-1470(+)
MTGGRIVGAPPATSTPQPQPLRSRSRTPMSGLGLGAERRVSSAGSAVAATPPAAPIEILTDGRPPTPVPDRAPAAGESPTNSITGAAANVATGPVGPSATSEEAEAAGDAEHGPATFAGYSLVAWASLGTLVAQNSSLTLVMRASRVRNTDQLYLPSVSVVSSEFLKIVASALLLYREQGSWESFRTSVYTDMLKTPVQSNWQLLIPASLYTLQNNLQYVAASNLDAAVFQVLYQMKLVTTAVVSVMLLRKSLEWLQWLAVLVLTLGVTLVQLSSMGSSNRSGDNSFVGFAAVVAACITSAFAGVYFERLVKTSKVSVWTRNMQLAFFGLVVGLFWVCGRDRELILQKGAFVGFDWVVLIVIGLQSLGGLLTAVVVKHADNVIKGFATGLAIIVSCLLSALFFGFVITRQYCVGSVFVIASVFLFSLHRAAAEYLTARSWKNVVLIGVVFATLLVFSLPSHVLRLQPQVSA